MYVRGCVYEGLRIFSHVSGTCSSSIILVLISSETLSIKGRV